MTSQSLMRTSQEVPGHAPRALAHPLSVPPAHACPTRPAQTSPSGSGHPSGPMALREGARPQDLQAHLCDPSLSCPLRTRCVPPHLGHAPGPLARPAGPVGRLRAQRPREPPPLAVRPAPSPLAVSCQASRVSPRHVVSLTTSWRRRGASSCRRWSNRELRIPILQERALESTQLYPTISFCCLEMVAPRRSPPRACVALGGA